jgi:hypothetical protein
MDCRVLLDPGGAATAVSPVDDVFDGGMLVVGFPGIPAVSRFGSAVPVDRAMRGFAIRSHVAALPPFSWSSDAAYTTMTPR